ncbi:hypothetical protein BJ508DRAFT_336561 [Ascobolus immersus RN42]|uniref:Uncharacterized protein n=1 Tax=Ascobolus immersus RN42 TaxID=1160509 RepID=A0A3N4HMT3_ASCIM|nr:hypothetical protein BJ508DRAFT_336561 [Ascobolus immersus RN42]
MANQSKLRPFIAGYLYDAVEEAINIAWSLAAFGQVDQLNEFIQTLKDSGTDGQRYLNSLWTKGCMVKKGSSKKMEAARLPLVQSGIASFVKNLHLTSNMSCCGFAIVVTDILKMLLPDYDGQYWVEFRHNGSHGLVVISFDTRSQLIGDSSVGKPVWIPAGRSTVSAIPFGGLNAAPVEYSFRPFRTGNGASARLVEDAVELMTKSFAGIAGKSSVVIYLRKNDPSNAFSKPEIIIRCIMKAARIEVGEFEKEDDEEPKDLGFFTINRTMPWAWENMRLRAFEA